MNFNNKQVDEDLEILDEALDGLDTLYEDEFEFEKKNYIVAEVIKDDTLDESGQYIYRCRMTEDGFTAEKITNAIDYEKVAKAYMEMED